MSAAIVSPRLMLVGGGSVREVAGVLAKFGLSRPLVVTDPYMVRSGLVRRCLDPLEAAGIAAAVFSDTVPEPTDTVVEAGVQRLEGAAFDCLIGFGGGSPIDTAKAMAILSHGRASGAGRRMRDFKVPVAADAASLPVIAVPTTGHSAAQGYSEVSGIPYGDGLYKNQYVGRTFIQPSQAMRQRVVQHPVQKTLQLTRLSRHSRFRFVHAVPREIAPVRLYSASARLTDATYLSRSGNVKWLFVRLSVGKWGRMATIKVAVIGVGNCASSLIQGKYHYAGSNTAAGLIHEDIGGYKVGDLEFVAEQGENGGKTTYQEASGAPVEVHSPLGTNVKWYTIIFLNLGQMIGTGVFSTRT